MRQKGRAPAKSIDQRAAEQRAEGQAQIDHAGGQADGPAASLWREDRGDNRDLGRVQHGRAGALQKARRDQRERISGEGGQQRSHDHAGRAREEQPLAPGHVSQAAEDQHKHGAGHEIGHLHPA